MYSIQQLKDTFEFLKNSSIADIKGCYCIDSKVEGACVGITALTHGDEPSGLAAFKYFLDNNIYPETGKIIFVANNIKAAENFFKATTDAEKEECRFIDINFNRLPENCLEIDAADYEIKRIKEVYPIYQSFDFGLDIHSTLTYQKPFIINISDDLDHGLFADFPDEMEDIVENMVNVQRGIPAVRLFGGKDRNIPILGIETGIHVAGESFEIAIKCALEFCRNCGLLPKSPNKTNMKKYKVYKVVRSVFYPDTSFATVRDFAPFEQLTTKTILAENNKNEKIFSPVNGLALFGNKKGHMPKTSNDEEFFITEEPYIIEK
jgi:hypothetical protein